MMARATVSMLGYPIRGTYHGGAYIDLSLGDGPAFEVINVYDYAAGRPTIPNTARAVRHALIEWRNDNRDYLAHDLPEYLLSVRGL
jgi:hypothetical protein